MKKPFEYSVICSKTRKFLFETNVAPLKHHLETWEETNDPTAAKLRLWNYITFTKKGLSIPRYKPFAGTEIGKSLPILNFKKKNTMKNLLKSRKHTGNKENRNIENNVEYERYVVAEKKIEELIEALNELGEYDSPLIQALEKQERNIFSLREVYDKQRLKEYSSKN
jgi:hypothetical protein